MIKEGHALYRIIVLAIIIAGGTSFGQQLKRNSMENEKLTIAIWSDIVCPFCYVGKKKLERAIDKLQLQDKVIIQWHSFELAPDFPKEKAIPSFQFLTETRGYPAAQLKKAQEHLMHQGKEYGIVFNFDTSLSFNTFDVHRLWQWSKTMQKDSEFKEAFMYAYFTGGIDLSKKENVLTIIGQLGLDQQKAQEILAGTAFTQEVLNDQKIAKELGIGGVPYFIINGKEIISGAQEDRVFQSVLQGALKTIPSNTQGGTCLPTGKCD
jgi:predicted DsbA family dithiol-disulfide isomerase